MHGRSSRWSLFLGGIEINVDVSLRKEADGFVDLARVILQNRYNIVHKTQPGAARIKKWHEGVLD